MNKNATELPALSNIAASYQRLMGRVDSWFHTCLEQHSDFIACKSGCSSCCRSLFDISLLDAWVLQLGFRELDEKVRQTVHAKTTKMVEKLEKQWPLFTHPYILNDLPFDHWQDMPDDNTPCPLLGENGRCLTYMHRPMICRLHGIPNIDNSGRSFSDTCCSRNFKGINPLELRTLRAPFKEIFEQEFDLLGLFSQHFFQAPRLELDTFIPTALQIDFNHLQNT